MRNEYLRTAAAASVLVGMFVFLISCGNQGPNTANRSETEIAMAPSPTPTPEPKACKTNDNVQKIADLRTDLNKLGVYDPDLADQLTIPGQERNFSIDFKEVPNPAGGPGPIMMVIKGRLIGDENPHSPVRKITKIAKLLKFLDRNMQRGCVDGVSFEANPSTAASTVAGESGFEWWAACEFPNVMCDGNCLRVCDKRKVKPTPIPSPSVSPSPKSNAPTNSTGTSSTSDNS